uniref:aldehyde oxidase GLOX n=1 Tax=Erigeron canadensis TaxID=72917 RepID=UPI001CB99850|nr:aldehyde oxidase GLOX [Erigeron canadensis]
MATLFKIQTFFIFFLATLFSIIPFSISDHHHHHHHHHHITTTQPPSPEVVAVEISPSQPPTFPPQNKSTRLYLVNTTPSSRNNHHTPLGTWTLLQKSIGISAMHMQLLHNNKVVIFDRTDFGPSNLSLPFGSPCRLNDEYVHPDCTSHSVLFDVASNTFRPLYVQTDVWCSSGAVDPSGTLVQTGGYHGGDHKIRLFAPCNDLDPFCDWVELQRNLSVQRWYSSNHILPDGNVIIVGGRRAYNYEFYPKNPDGMSSLLSLFNFTFLIETTDYQEENNLYPFLHLLPDGNLFVFANQRSVLLDYVHGRVIREFPPIPGEKRSYPSTGSSVLLPISLGGSPEDVEVMICGGAQGGSFSMAERGIYMAAARSCGRMKLTEPNPVWVMEKMPLRRVMPDMILLPTGDVLIINGAARGTAGWENAIEPVLNPVLYEVKKRLFTVLSPTRRPRMYHSAATLLPDGRILVGGSNPHVSYVFTGVNYTTDLTLESFSPPYLDERYAYFRPTILTVDYGLDETISYGQEFSLTLTMSLTGLDKRLMVSLVAPSFTTHSFAMNQRVLFLHIADVAQLSVFGYRVTVRAPSSPNIAPPGYYMLFVVHDGIPGQSVWVKLL